MGALNQSTNLGDNSGTSRLGKSSQSSSKLEKRTIDSTENELEKYHNGMSKMSRKILILLFRDSKITGTATSICPYRTYCKSEQLSTTNCIVQRDGSAGPIWERHSGRG